MTDASVAQLEQTIDKIIDQTYKNILSGIDDAADQSRQTLDDVVMTLQQEYDKILSDAKKEADKISRQIVGSADLGVRNKQLLALEEAVDRVFTQALERVASADRSGSEYAELLRSLLAESVSILGSQDVVIHTSSKDRDAVMAIAASEYPSSEVSQDPLECMGGVLIRSKDGAMTFDNTLDARIDRMKPLIRKQVATKFGAGS